MAVLSAPEALALDFGFALDVEGAFAASVGNVVNLVLTFGRTGKRPSLFAGAAEATPRLAANGKPGVCREAAVAETLFGERIGQRLLEEPAKPLRKDLYPKRRPLCGLEWFPSPQGQVNDRADYLAWRLGLQLLSERLSGTLIGIAAFGAGADRLHGAAEQRAMAARRAGAVRRTVAPSSGKLRRPARPGRGQMTG